MFKTPLVRISQKYQAQKRPKFSTCCKVSLKSTYFYQSTKIAKAGPGLGMMKFLKKYENLQNWIFLKTILIRISQKVYKKYHAQKRRNICMCCRVSEAKVYLYHSTKIDDWIEQSPVQTNSSCPLLELSIKINLTIPRSM